MLSATPARPRAHRRRRARRRVAGRATRVPTSPGPRRSWPGCRTPSPACSSTASAPPASRPSTSPRRRSRSGWEDLVLAGGVESMSRVPMGSDGGAWAMDPRRTTTPLRAAGHRRRPDRHDRGLQPRGRRPLRRALAGARRQAHGPRATSPARSCRCVDRNGLVVLDHDEHIRPGTTVETLGDAQAVLRRRSARWAASTPSRCRSTTGSSRSTTSTPPATRRASSTARRSSSIGNEQRGTALGLTPRARIVATAVSGADPTIMLTGPGPAARKALAKAGLTADDIDLFEINEAFAAVVLRFVKDMGLDIDKVNVNGGAIAMGHPLGATGAMILGTLLDELERRDRATAWPRSASAAAWASRPSSSGSEGRREKTRMTEQHDDPLGPGRGRHRHPDARRPGAVREHDERRVPGVDGRDRRPSRGREGRASPASSSPPRRRRSSPAATSTTCAGRRRRPRPASSPTASARSRASCAAWRRSASRSSPRSTAPRSAAAWRSPRLPPPHRRRRPQGPRSACPRCTLGLLPGGGGVVRTRADARHRRRR